MKSIMCIYEGILDDNVIKESILSDIEKTIDRGESDAQKLVIFGKRYKFTNAHVGSAAGTMFNMKELKSFTKEHPCTNTKIERGYFEKSGKVKMFANWLDQLNLIDADVNINGNDKDKDFRKELGNKIEQYAFKCGMFNNSAIHLWVGTFNLDGLDILIGNMNKHSNSYTVRLCYEIDK